jgi:V8-like Glu-specific endopeptidase
MNLFNAKTGHRVFTKWRNFLFLAAISCIPVFFMLEVRAGSTTVESPALQVNATEIATGDGVFRPNTDIPLAVPTHPPLDEIPFMAMPDPSDTTNYIGYAGVGDDYAIYHDASTDQTFTSPMLMSSEFEGVVTGGGYHGADGGGLIREGDPVDAFADMTEVTNTAVSPWRMNVKLVMRFVSQGGDVIWSQGSGTMRAEGMVLTAGHCVYARSHQGVPIFAWATDIWVYPGHDDDGGTIVFPYGVAHSTHYGSWAGWIYDGNLDNDVGIIYIERAVGYLTGWFSWAYGGDCSWHLDKTYNNASYPVENCPISGLHTGDDMYYWYGNFDSCPDNQLELTTGGGNCFDTVWGGMSGSGAYYIDGDNRHVYAICSTSNRTTWGRYVRQWDTWVDWINENYIPERYGTEFNLQALNMVAEPATIISGNQTTTLNHLAVNPTFGTKNSNFVYRVYLSTDDTITSSDTLLSTQTYNRDFGERGAVRVNMVQVTIPVNTSTGYYWLGVIYDAETDYDPSDNDTSGWDASRIYVVQATPTPTPTPTRTPTRTPTPPDDCVHHGDVNLDGLITAADAQLAFFIVLGQYTPTYQQECAADCNGDGVITAADAQLIFLTVLGSGSCADPL